MSNVTEWRSSGRDSRYPFNDDSSLVSNRGWEIPRDLFCDAQICSGGYSKLRVSSVTTYSSGRGLTFTVSSPDGVFASFSIKPGQPKSVVTGNYGEYRGTIIVSPDIEIPVLLLAQTFSDTAAVFESSVLYQLPDQCVQSITVDKQKVYNRVYLVEGEGINIVKLDDKNVRVDAIGKPTDPLPQCFQQGTPLRSFSVVVNPGVGQQTVNYTQNPNQYGNVSILPAPIGTPESDSSPRQILSITQQLQSQLNFSLSR
jgi:hypothetical protein